ncbi:MAG: HEAT repeat domain-containing protein, partial [Planctomycetota bacterium]|nr:HEAT repeat domain-containing protein [Planctomycetota bacterium]
VNDGTLYIIPANFETIGGSIPSWSRVWSNAFRDVILLHEIVHVLQYRRLDLKRFVFDARSQEELIARSAVIEGHAQHLAHEAALPLGLKDAFDLMTTVQSKAPEEIPDGFMKSFIEGAQSITSFPYQGGLKFWRAVVLELGYDAALERIFSAPPTSVAMIADPAKYMTRISAFNTARRRVARWVRDVEGEVVSVLERRGSARSIGFEIDGLTLRLSLDPDGVLGVVAEGGKLPARTDRWLGYARELVAGVEKEAPWRGLRGDEAKDAFVRTLHGDGWGLRWRAIRNLGRMTDREGVTAALRRALEDGDARIRAAALRALDRAGLLRESDARMSEDVDWEVAAAAREVVIPDR